MRKVGKVEIFNNFSGIIYSDDKNYKFRREDIVYGEIKVGDEVSFVPEMYPYEDRIRSEYAARFVKKKELQK